MSPSTRTSRNASQSESRNTSRHTQNYAYAIVASCIAIMFFPCAIILTCFGIFITPVTQYFGVPKVSFSLVFSVICLTMMVALPITGRLLKNTACARFLRSTRFFVVLHTVPWDWCRQFGSSISAALSLELVCRALSFSRANAHRKLVLQTSRIFYRSVLCFYRHRRCSF